MLGVRVLDLIGVLNEKKFYIVVNNVLYCVIVGKICKILLLLFRFECDCFFLSLF